MSDLHICFVVYSDKHKTETETGTQPETGTETQNERTQT